MEYISKKSCSIWTVCPCYYKESVLLPIFERYKSNKKTLVTDGQTRP